MKTADKPAPRPGPRFQLNDRVLLLTTREIGVVTQRCENATREPEYRVRVDSAFGHSVFRPANESDLEAAAE